MIRFECDYLEGAHPAIMDALMKANMEQTVGYGVDEYCESARGRILDECGLENAAIHFISGGTQTNLIACSAFLKPWQGAICADSGHIAVHESGSVEATGHKVLTIPAKDSKITAAQVEDFCEAHYSDSNVEAAVEPGMVYISQPTEYGTIYSRRELQEMKRVCEKYHMPLFIDGARLIYALACRENDADLKDIAHSCDAFYIGGTKAGLLLGEAMVIVNPELNAGFRHTLKQRGAMLAKGRVLGIQFDTLFKDGLYKEIGAHAMTLADKIRKALSENGFEFYVGSPTNQIFIVMEDALVEKLKDRYSFALWEKAGKGRSVMRICTSWATDPKAVDCMLNDVIAAKNA